MLRFECIHSVSDQQMQVKAIYFYIVKKQQRYISFDTLFSDCQDGQYISNRQCIPCQGHCKIGAHCNKSTGRCDYGCENHWTGDICNCTCSFFFSLTTSMGLLDFAIVIQCFRSEKKCKIQISMTFDEEIKDIV